MAEAGTGDRHRGTRAIQRMVEYAPSTGGLALWVGHRDLPDDGDDASARPVIATDGHTLHYRADFEQRPIAAQIGHVAHEVLHIALRHPQRFVELRQVLGDVDLRLWTVCADAIVNSALGHLAWLELPDAGVTLERLLAAALGIDRSAEAALLEWDVERLYRAIDDRRPMADEERRGDGIRGGGAGQARSQAGAREDGARSAQVRDDGPTAAGAGAREDGRKAARVREDGPKAARVRALGRDAGADLLPVPDDTADDTPEFRADQIRAWRERLLRAHVGDGPHSMLRTLLADLPQPRTPWAQVLRTQLARGLSTRPDLSWSRPSRSYIANQGRAGAHRRLPWEPGFSGTKRVPRLAVVVDVSGSIDEAVLERFAREIDAITRRLEAGLVLVVGDDRVRRVDHFAPGAGRLPGIAFDGGGGTDFTPLLEEADRHFPDIGVVLTDLEGPARFRPRWPVIWAVPAASTAAAPFGRRLTLD